MNTLSYRTASDDFASTIVENLFINELMPEADGDFVKIYLYGLKNSQNPGVKPLNNQELAHLLGIPESKILEAYEYWQEKGILRIDNVGGDYTITFGSVKGAVTKEIELKTSQDMFPSSYKNSETFKDLVLKAESMLGGQILPARFIQSIIYWIEQYNFDYECICFLLEYCLTTMNPDEFHTLNGKINYLNKVAENWHSEGIQNMHDAIFYTEEYKANNQILYNVLSELGIHRAPIRLEKDLVNKWVHEYNFDRDIIMEGVRRTAAPSLSYLDKILTGWHASNYTTLEEVQKAPRKTFGHRKGAAKKGNQPSQTVSEDRIKAMQEIEDSIFETFRKNKAVAEL